MRTLSVAALFVLLPLVLPACSGAGAVPAISALAVKRTHAVHHALPGICPGDTGGIQTGDSRPCRSDTSS